jgi:sigma-B regulation protein RsbU (phosphoserine phosphatase)
MSISQAEHSLSQIPGRRIIASLCILLAIGAVAGAWIQYTTVRKFEVPIAYTMVGDRFYVLEKKGNTILKLEYLSPELPLALRGRFRIEPEDADRYYMARKLYPGPEGVVVQSYIYEKNTENFIGYRFREYRSFREKPRDIFTIYLKEPGSVPEINYSRGPGEEHYFVNNIPNRRNIWVVPASGDITMSGGVLPPGLREDGDINDAFASWASICVGPNRAISISSGSNGRIMRYSPVGELSAEWGTVGFEEGDLLAPDEIFFITLSHDLPRSLTVASTGNRSWVQFSPAGKPLLTVYPLKDGYQKHFRDILVGTIYASESSGQLFSFDPVNRSFIILSRDYSVITTYSSTRLGWSAVLLASAVLFLAGAIFSRGLARVAARLRFPFFIKLLLLFVPILVISAMAVGYEVKKIMKEDLEAEYIRRSANLAAAILKAVSVSDLEMLREIESRETQLYKDINKYVTEIVNRDEVDYTPKWIIHLIDDQGRYFFGINIWRGSLYEPFIVPAEREIFQKVLTEKTPQYGRFVDEQGEWFSYLSPIINAEGKVINVLELYRPTEEMDRADRRASAKILERTGETVLVAILLVLIFSYIFTRPLRKLIQGIKVVSKGDFDHKIIVRSRDELSRVAGAFNQMSIDLKKYIRDLARTTAEKERIETELHFAREVQQGILPKVFPPYPDAPSIEIFARMVPAREVGGDFYDFFPIDQDHIGVVVADVSGKGMPAGLFMMVVRTLLRNNAFNNLGAADAIARTNRIIAADNPSMLFVTIFYCICNLKTGHITFCNAGHNPPFIIKEDGPVLLSTKDGAGKGVAVGVLEDADYTNGEFTLSEGETLVLYTDGATEAFNAENQIFGEDRLLGCIEKNTGLSNRELWEAIYQEVSTFQAGREQFDDITILLFTFLGI